MVTKGVTCCFNSSRLFFTLFSLIVLMVMFSVGVSAEVTRGFLANNPTVSYGNVTMKDYNIGLQTMYNESFNFTNQSMSGSNASKSGHIRFNNYTWPGSNYNDPSFEYVAGDALTTVRLLFMGHYDGGDDGVKFLNNFKSVPNASYRDSFDNRCYGCWENIEGITKGDVVAVYIRDATDLTNTSKGTYAAVYFLNVQLDNNVSFVFKYNNMTANNSFSQPLTGCDTHTDVNACFNDHANECDWQFGVCKAREHEDFGGNAFAGCEMMPRVACEGMNTSYCLWNWSVGPFGHCTPGPNVSVFFGFNCTQIVNATFCANQPFTEGTGLCTWNISGTEKCEINLSKTLDNITDPPVFSCEATDYVNDQAKCENLSNTFYMPCGWNNKTSKCENLFFDYARYDDFGDINSQDTCKVMGGTWKDESTYDPILDKVTSEKWCEFGTSIPTFDQVGKSGGAGFFGSGSQLASCARDCYACEFNNSASPPAKWPDLAASKQQCEQSGAGCTFRPTGNAFNGYGWCVPSGGADQGLDCDTRCGDCSAATTPQAACQNSSANCRWDNSTSLCLDKGAKGCSDNCMQCFNKDACDKSLGQGGCTWDNTSGICTPKGGSFEICYDGVDNDNNAKTDCADFKCSSDPFCAGGSVSTANCFQYNAFTYGNLTGAQNNCTGTTGCVWIIDDFTYGWCSPQSDLCWQNASFQNDATGCENLGGGNVCEFVNEGQCGENTTRLANCTALVTQATCDDGTKFPGCKWNVDHSYCDIQSIVVCEHNTTLQNNEGQCRSSGCIWQGNETRFHGGSFDGGHFQNCISPCIADDVDTQLECQNATNATAISNFRNGTCAWFGGRCEPQSMMGECIYNDGDYEACTENTNCAWTDASNFASSQIGLGGPLRALNGSYDARQEIHTTERWVAVGLQRPYNASGNLSRYILNTTSGYLMLEAANSSGVNHLNVSRLYCNTTLIVEYNFSSAECQVGNCNIYVRNATCSSRRVHYFLNTTLNHAKMGALEVVWEYRHGKFGDILFDSNYSMSNATSNNVTTNVTNITTVILDGVLNEHIPENSSGADYFDSGRTVTNGTRVLTSPGFCDGKFQGEMFAGMDSEPPVPIAGDSSGDGLSGHGYTDLTGIGMKKTPEAFMYGMPTANFNGSVICKGIPLRGTSTLGNGTNTSKYYLYLDTDGVETGGCKPFDNSSLNGFEYLFKYSAELSGTTNQIEESLLTQECYAGTWIASPVSLKSDKKKACDFVGGPIMAISRDSISGKTGVNMSRSWRAYAASAALGGNVSNVTDRAGPGEGDFKGIDADVVDCTSTRDKDNSLCSTFKQFGFVPGEFGPACKDAKDNDADGSTDCDDYDCKYDPFFCSGSFSAVSGDESAPSYSWTKTNDKLTTALTIVFGTNEPANGTVLYYYNDTGCSLLNDSVKDFAFNNTDAHDDYRPHHVADINGLNANKTYFYKMRSCDPTGNCAVSKCLNATTATVASNITFKIEVPSGWTIDIPRINLSNFSGKYAIKAGTDQLNDINITINQTNSSLALSLNGVDIFEKQTLNCSRFFTGSGFLGIDANQYQSFKQKTGLDNAVVHIPTESKATTLEHCRDDGTECQAVTSKVTCTFSDTMADCTVPDAVGLGFSSYKTGGSSGGSGGSGGSSGGGAGGGGGGSGPAATAVTALVETSHFFDTAKAGMATAAFAKADLAVTAVDIQLTKDVVGLRLAVSSYNAAPAEVKAFAGPAYQYIQITKANVESTAIASAAIAFTVTDAWVKEKSIALDAVTLYRYDDVGAWNALSTTYIGSSDGVHSYKATTPGFSYFVIGTESVAASPSSGIAPTGAATGEIPLEGSSAGEQQQPAGVAPIAAQASESEASGAAAMLWAALIVGLIALVGYVIHRRK